MARNAQSVGNLYTVALDFRERALRRDAQVAGELTDAYGRTFQDVQGYFNALSERVRRDIDAGETFTVDRLRRLERYAALLDQVRNRTEEFAQYAPGVIANGQARSVRQALAESERLARLATERALLDVPEEQGRGALPPGISIEAFNQAFNRVPQESLDFLVGSLGDGTPLRQYFLEGGSTADAPPLSEAVIDQVRRNLAEALVAGWNPRRTATLFRQAMGVGLTRALRISRTEQLRSYREASRANYANNGFQQWEWLTALDDRVCLACVGLDGEIFDIQQPQQAHVQCRCTMVPVLPFRVPRLRRVSWPQPGEFEGTGADWFDGLSPLEKQTLMGPSKFRAYEAGAVTLADFRHEDDSRAETFGTQFVEASLRQVLGTEADRFYTPA